MYIIADSGSTKTDWLVANDTDIVNRIKTQGINPYYQDWAEIKQVITEELLPFIEASEIYDVYFYGAGCAYPDKNLKVENALRESLNIDQCSIESDMLGVCRSTLGHNAGIACILGTGSNSCFYDGVKIVKNVSPLGFILGDEGSGATLGRHLVADCLKNQMTDHIKEQFLEEFNTTQAEIIDRVYRKPFPNRYLASLSEFLARHIDYPECRKIVERCFREFFERNIMQYEMRNDTRVCFVGSVAWYYREILCDVASVYGMKIEGLHQSPLEGLLEYHIG